jgi:hypothetical protein
VSGDAGQMHAAGAMLDKEQDSVESGLSLFSTYASLEMDDRK